MTAIYHREQVWHCLQTRAVDDDDDDVGDGNDDDHHHNSGLQEAIAYELSFAAQATSLFDHIGQVSIIVIIIMIMIIIIIIIIITKIIETKLSSAGVSTSQSYNSANEELEFDLYDYRGSREWWEMICYKKPSQFSLPPSFGPSLIFVIIISSRYNMSLRELAENKMIFDDELEQVLSQC